MFPRRAANRLIVVVENDKTQSQLICRWLENAGYETKLFYTGEEFLKNLPELLPSAVLLDLNLPQIDIGSTLQKVYKKNPFLPVIVIATNVEIHKITTAMQFGAYDYLSKPPERTKLLTIVKNAVEKHQLSLRLEKLEREKNGFGYKNIVGNSSVMKELFRQIDNLVSSDISVLIYGDSGTGKELVARAIHDSSTRKDKPFISLNCSAIPESLHETEIFGLEKSLSDNCLHQIGKLELAHGGTLFLDGISELNATLQAKLLRVLQEKKFQRVDGFREVPTDFRLIASSNFNLLEAVEQKRFRADLYYRIAVFELELPRLKERKDDIPLLAKHFLDELNKKSLTGLKLSQESLDILMSYDYPGNVRELQNALYRAAVVAQDETIKPQDLPKRILNGDYSDKPFFQLPKNGNGDGKFLTTALTLDEIEREAIKEAIKKAKGNMSEVIRRLKIGRATLYRKLKKYNLTRDINSG